MTRYCSDCENLNLKKEGPPGCYECKKRKKEKVKSVWECQPACEKYEYDWSRGETKRQKVFKKALREIHVDRHPMKASELIVFVLIAFALWIVSILSK